MRYLIVQTGFLGESILTSSFITILQQKSGVIIDVISEASNFAAFQYNPLLKNKFFIYKKATSNSEKLHNIEVMKKVLEQNYGAVFILSQDLIDYLLIKQITTRFIFGYCIGDKGLRAKLFYLTAKLKNKYHYINYDNNIHDAVNFHMLLEFSLQKMGILKDYSPYLKNKCYFYTKNYNSEQMIWQDSSTIVLNISGKKDSLQYIPTVLARCIIEDIMALKQKVLIIAHPDDEGRANLLLKDFSSSRVSCYCNPDIFNIADVMACYQYFISADNNLLQVAAGLQMICIGLYHDQNIKAKHPWCEKYVCIQADDHKIYNLTSDKIINALRQFINN